MSVFNQSRQNVIRLIFIAMFAVVIARLFMLQIVSSKYKILADDQSKFRKIVYPDRGVVYDRKGRVILDNTTIYDLMVIPGKVKGIDTASLCDILDIDTLQFKKRLLDAVVKNTKIRPSVFEALLSDETKARLDEAMYRFEPAFYLQERPVRSYPYEAAGNVLGYLSEVDTSFLKNHTEEGYQIGDYAGKAGIERTYEKVLMGQRGIEYWKRDNKNRLTERLENGKYDTAAIPGQSVHTSIDIELQQLGEKLMANKIGAIVALDPKTGGILAMVSAPTYKPGLLTGSEKRKNYSRLFKDPSLPLLNRAVNAYYSPGSTFKTLQALVALKDGVITPTTTVSCSGAFWGCGTGKPKCLDPGTFYLKTAITHSCNTYFATVMQRVIDNPKWPTVDSSLNHWAKYMYGFGLGHKLGVDVPSEKSGKIPTAATYNKVYGQGHWNFCTISSISIGQGEVLTTPIQVANEMAYLANDGWYITPHVVDSIDGGDKFGLLAKYKERHKTLDIPDSIFDAVHDGMQGVVESGTGMAARVPGIVICGKTGTVENYYHGEKQKNHAFFAAFAPRDNPKIAIMCVVENSGMGGTYAAPIVSLLLEKYLKDSITDPKRLAQIETISKMNLIPARIYQEARRIDSLDHSKDSGYLLSKGYIKSIKDTVGIDDDDEEEALDKLKNDVKTINTNKPKKDSGGNQLKDKPQAILPDEQKKQAQKDTVNR